MSEYYEPPSDFLKSIISDDVDIPLGGSEFGQTNLDRLVALTADPDRTNRDWAVLLLAQTELNTAQVQAALLRAAQDVDEYVRGEAVIGLARRDPTVAIPYIRSALKQETVSLQIFEAAELVAHPSLIYDLQDFTDGEEYIDELARRALAACERAASVA